MLSSKAKYAVRAATMLAERADSETWTHTAEIAERERIVVEHISWPTAFKWQTVTRFVSIVPDHDLTGAGTSLACMLMMQ